MSEPRHIWLFSWKNGHGRTIWEEKTTYWICEVSYGNVETRCSFVCFDVVHEGCLYSVIQLDDTVITFVHRWLLDSFREYRIGRNAGVSRNDTFPVGLRKGRHWAGEIQSGGICATGLNNCHSMSEKQCTPKHMKRIGRSCARAKNGQTTSKIDYISRWQQHFDLCGTHNSCTCMLKLNL